MTTYLTAYAAWYLVSRAVGLYWVGRTHTEDLIIGGVVVVVCPIFPEFLFPASFLVRLGKKHSGGAK